MQEAAAPAVHGFVGRPLNRDSCLAAKRAQREASTSVKFSEDVLPLTDLKVNPGPSTWR